LEAARRDLAEWSERFDNYSGNNPNKYQSDIKAARRRVRELENQLKASGVLPLSAQEQLDAELDRAFPSARSKQIVEYEGRKYQRQFWPLERSNCGKTVTEWGKSWEDVTDKE
jgi:predicted  nucleic acid-binding Zn-ribbon protein